MYRAAAELEDEVLSGGQKIRLIHHPGGEPLVISDVGEIKQSGSDYIFHDVEARKGSSGAPLFNMDWRVVAIHRGSPSSDRNHEPGTTEGVPIRAFWNKI